MLIWLLPLIVLGVCALLILALITSKIPTLRVIDVQALPEEKTKKLKEEIILQQLERRTGPILSWIRARAVQAGRAISRAGRRLVQRLYSIEQSYQKMQKSIGQGARGFDPRWIKRLSDEAEVFIKQGEYFEAEKRFIEIISHQPKHAKTYERLGHLYVLDRKFEQAKETLTFALKLRPKDASVHAYLGELALEEGQVPEALAQFRQAVDARPHNPKYLDFYIESALQAASAEDARRGIDLLRSVNPENHKLAEFEERIQKIGL